MSILALTAFAVLGESAAARNYLNCVSKKVVIIDAPKGTTSSSTEESFGFWIDEATKVVTLADGKRLNVGRFGDHWISATSGDVSYELDRRDGHLTYAGSTMKDGIATTIIGAGRCTVAARAVGRVSTAHAGGSIPDGFWQDSTSERPIFDRAAVGACGGDGHWLALRDLAQRLVDKIPSALQVLEPRRGPVVDAAVVDERSFAVDHVHMRGGAGAVRVPDFAHGIEQRRDGRRRNDAQQPPAVRALGHEPPHAKAARSRPPPIGRNFGP